MVEPYSPRFELDDQGLPPASDTSRSVEIPMGYDPDAKIERTPAPTGAPDADHASDQPSTWPQDFDSILVPPSEQEIPFGAGRPVEEAPASTAEDSSAGAEVPEPAPSDDAASEAESAAARAKVFAELFPPGSSQAALLEHDRKEREAAAAQPDDANPQPQAGAPEPPANASIPAPPPADEDERQRGIEEIRRLTEAAISGIEKESQRQTEAPEPDGSGRYEMPAEPEAEHGFPVAGEPAPLSGGLAPHHATFDEALRAPSTEIPVRPVTEPDQSQGSVPSPWGSHPLDAAQPSVPRQVDDFQPVSDAPRPDFSQLYKRPPQSGQSPTTSGQFPVSGQFPTSGQTGQLRRAPELPPVGGAKHFKWLHLAVIGALMFLLGVVIYNVAFGQ